jgi:hypothetical protein
VKLIPYQRCKKRRYPRLSSPPRPNTNPRRSLSTSIKIQLMMVCGGESLGHNSSGCNYEEVYGMTKLPLYKSTSIIIQFFIMMVCGGELTRTLLPIGVSNFVSMRSTPISSP